MSRPKEFYIKIIVILFIILMAVLIFVKFNTDNNSTQITEEQKKELFSKIEKNTNAKVTKFASYGTHFNLEGNIEIPKISGIKINYVDVVIKTLDGTENSFKSNFNYSDNICSFSSSDEINSGLNLEELSLNTYYLFAKVTYSNGDIKYYSLANDSEYGNITYYTITKNNSNNKIDIFFDEYNNLKLMSISVVKASSLPDDVYDIVTFLIKMPITDPKLIANTSTERKTKRIRPVSSGHLILNIIVDIAIPKAICTIPKIITQTVLLSHILTVFVLEI